MKNDEKRLQNDAKMDAKIFDFSCFFEKCENARNYLFYHIKRGSGHLKMHQQSIQNLCKIDARKRHAKSMENDAKMHPKWEPKSIQNLKNTGKNGIRKLMPKFDAKKNQNVSRAPDFNRFWIDFSAGPGGKGGGRYLKIPD